MTHASQPTHADPGHGDRVGIAMFAVLAAVAAGSLIVLYLQVLGA